MIICRNMTQHCKPLNEKSVKKNVLTAQPIVWSLFFCLFLYFWCLCEKHLFERQIDIPINETSVCDCTHCADDVCSFYIFHITVIINTLKFEWKRVRERAVSHAGRLCGLQTWLQTIFLIILYFYFLLWYLIFWV